MSEKLKFESKATMRINSVPTWGHSTEISFNGNEPKDFEVSFKILNDIVNFDHENEFNQSLLKGSRHGSLLSVTNKTRWTLDLIAKSHLRWGNEKLSPPKIIEEFINAFTNQDLTPKILKKRNKKKRASNMYLSIRGLMLPFYVFKRHEVKEDEKIVDEILMHEVRDVFLPDISFHPVSIVRKLFLGALKPELLDVDDIFQRELEMIPHFNSDHFISLIDESNTKAFQYLGDFICNGVNIAEVISNVNDHLDHIEDRSILSNQTESNVYQPPQVETKFDIKTKHISIGTLDRRFGLKNGLAKQLSAEHLTDIQKHLDLLCLVSKKSAEIKSYYMQNLDASISRLEKGIDSFEEQKSQEPPEIIDPN